jgi:hypothetical protein
VHRVAAFGGIGGGFGGEGSGGGIGLGRLGVAGFRFFGMASISNREIQSQRAENV